MRKSASRGTRSSVERRASSARDVEMPESRTMPNAKKKICRHVAFRRTAHFAAAPPDRPHCSSTPATPWVPRSKKSRTSFLPWRTSTMPPPRNPATPRYARLDRAPIERRARNEISRRDRGDCSARDAKSIVSSGPPRVPITHANPSHPLASHRTMTSPAWTWPSSRR